MQPSEIYFTDNFFSAGITDIFNEQKDIIGALDLKSAFSSSVDVIDQSGKVVVKGRFPLFSRKWIVSDNAEHELGALKQRFSFFTKKYEYDTKQRGVYHIQSEALSREYCILNSQEEIIATFKRTNGIFASPTYCLTNHFEQISNEELIAVVMGVNMIRKRNNASAINNGSL
jgi:uncharacterized protein YxjI